MNKGWSSYIAADFACWCWYVISMSYIWILSISYDTGAILILEHSFFLVQQKDSQPILSAAEKYKASDISTKVEAALQDVSIQYNTASREGKIGMIFNIVMQNRMSKSHMCFHAPFQNLTFLFQELQQLSRVIKS